MHVFPCDAVQLAHRNSGAHRIECGLLGAEHQIVNRLLARCELPVHRKRARDVGGVLAPLRRRVDHDEVTVFRAAPVHVVMQRRGIGTAADDRRIPETVSAVAAETGFERSFQLVLVHPRPRGPHRGDMAGDADVHGATQPGDLVGVLDGAHRVDNRRDVQGGGCRVGGALSPPVASRRVQGLPRGADAIVERIERQHGGNAGEPHGHTVGPEPQPRPPLLRRGPRWQKQHRLE